MNTKNPQLFMLQLKTDSSNLDERVNTMDEIENEDRVHKIDAMFFTVPHVKLIVKFAILFEKIDRAKLKQHTKLFDKIVADFITRFTYVSPVLDRKDRGCTPPTQRKQP